MSFQNHPISPSQWSELWQAAFRILEDSFIPNQLMHWIQPLEFAGSDTQNGHILVKLSAPHEFSATWVRDRYQKHIETALTQVFGSPCKVEISASNTSAPSELAGQDSLVPSNELIQTSTSASWNPSVPSHPVVGQVVSLGATDPSLDPKYAFDTFIVGTSNQFAHASAIAVAEAPGRHYNPLFLYSPPGLGKTHLLHAIGNQFLKRHPNGKILYISAEDFVNELVESLRAGKMSLFRSKYRNSYDLILIDDIQFIAGKKSSEEEFFHTFNALHSSKRQIVVSSDRPPKEITGLEERIRTRLEWGLIADIQPPEIETRIAILKSKAEQEDIYLPDEVTTFLATHVKSNVRELEGVLIRLQMRASLTGAEISLDMAKQELKSLVPQEGPSYTVEAIQNTVAKYYRIKIQDLKSTSRARSVSEPRQIAMYLIRKYTGLAYKDIGGYFGGKDHTTIMHACSKIGDGIEQDDKIRSTVEAIQNLL